MILAEAVGSGAEALAADSPFIAYLNLGVIVVMLALFYTRKLRTGSEVEEIKAELKLAREQTQKLVDHYQQDVLPALIEQTRIGGDLVEALREFRN